MVGVRAGRKGTKYPLLLEWRLLHRWSMQHRLGQMSAFTLELCIMTINKSAVFAALNAFATAANEATKRLRATLCGLGITTAEDARPLVIEWASTKYGCPIVVSQSNKNKGALVLDRAAPCFAAADKAMRRLMEALKGDADEGTSSAKAEEKTGVEVPAHIAKLAAALAAACNEYESAKKLASTAVAGAFAK